MVSFSIPARPIKMTVLMLMGDLAAKRDFCFALRTALD
jgi:hypothetical protein